MKYIRLFQTLFYRAIEFYVMAFLVAFMSAVILSPFFFIGLCIYLITS